MKPLFLAIAVVAVVVAMCASVLILSTFPNGSATSGSNDTVRSAWNSSFNGCCFDAGLQNPAILSGPTIPSGTSVAYLNVSLSVTSWTHFTGTGNATGGCSPPVGPVGACDVYIGVWTPTAWNAYQYGGPLSPFWCFTTNSSTCTATSAATFTSSSLIPLEGQTWEVVIWNLQSYGLSGTYSVSLLVSPNFWS